MRHKGHFTKDEQREIIRLYTEENRGKKYIGSLYGRSDHNLNYWLRQWGVPSLPRSTVSKKIRQVYGPTPGFSGRKHSTESRKQISTSGKESWERLGREARIGKSRTYKTIIGNVLGRYEVAYLQKLQEENQPLPKLCRKRHKTPHGSYMADFEFQDRLIEIKSPFTLKVAKGQYARSDGVLSDCQWKKIDFVNKNIMPVEIIVLEQQEAMRLFTRAKEGVMKCCI